MSIRVVEGDLLDQDVEAIANAWNRNFIPWFLLVQHGVAGDIRRRAGTLPFRELGLRPMRLGEARVTSAGRLPFRAIVHVPGIDWNWTSSVAIAASAALGATQAAIGLAVASFAMPVFGSGVGGLDPSAAIDAMLAAVEMAGPAASMDLRIVRYVPRPG